MNLRSGSSEGKPTAADTCKGDQIFSSVRLNLPFFIKPLVLPTGQLKVFGGTVLLD